jgi:RNA polymerase sigma factor (sigma-70 family)
MERKGSDLEARIGRGDEKAIEEAYDAYFTQMMNFAYYTVNDYDTALDISQDAFLKVVRAIQENRAQVRNLKSYLFGTVKNLAVNEMRRSAKLAEYPKGPAEPTDPQLFADPVRAAQLSEQRAQVAAAVSRLNENQRVALTLKDIEGWSYEEIGELLGMSSNAVGVLLSRARLKFRREYRLQQIDETLMTEECLDFLPLMCAVLDSEATDAQKETLQTHLASCPQCAQAMNEMAGAATTFRSMVPLAPLAAVKAAVMGSAVSAAAAAASGAGAGAAAAGAAGAAAGMSALTKAVITGVAALVVAGASVGSYVGIKKLRPEPAPPQKKTSVPAAAAPAAPARVSDGIVFVRDGDLFAANTDGTGETRLTTGQQARRLAVSPGGNLIAFQSAGAVIFIMNASGGDLRQVTLTERGRAENPAFSPDEKYLYFTRVKPEDLALIDSNQPYTVTFERYDIAANSVSTVYAKSGIFENGSVYGLFCSADGSELYFNVYGSDWPSSEALRLTLGDPASEGVLLPRVRDEANPANVTCFRVVDTSHEGRKIAYYRESTQSSPGGEPSYVVESCIRDTDDGQEYVVERTEHAGIMSGDIDAVKFSYAGDRSFICSRRTQPSPGQAVFEYSFLSGDIEKPGLSPLGLNLTDIDDWRVRRVQVP